MTELFKTASRPNAHPERILLARLDRLGDVVLSTPVIRHMRKLYPGAFIAFMVRPENRDIVENNPDLNEIILYDKAGSEKSILGKDKEPPVDAGKRAISPQNAGLRL